MPKRRRFAGGRGRLARRPRGRRFYRSRRGYGRGRGRRFSRRRFFGRFRRFRRFRRGPKRAQNGNFVAYSLGEYCVPGNETKNSTNLVGNQRGFLLFPQSGTATAGATFWRQPVTWNVISNGKSGQRLNQNFGGNPAVLSITQLGFTSNQYFTLGSLPTANFQDWSASWKYIRLNRVRVTYFIRSSPRSSVTFDNTLSRQAPTLLRGGDLAFMCTNRTGPVTDIYNTSLPFGNDSNQMAYTSYGVLTANDGRLHRKVVRRADVLFGMRPVRFKFRPGVVKVRPRVPWSDANSNASFGLSATTLFDQSLMRRFAPAPWIPMSAMAPGGQPVNEATGQSMVNGGYELVVPHYGMVVALAPYSLGSDSGSALTESECEAAWPRLKCKVSFEIGLRGRYTGSLTTSDLPAAGYNDFGAVPTSVLSAL